MGTPKNLITDFERAAMNAAKEVFDGLKTYGCAFHWTQALWRKMQKYRLAREYKGSNSMRKFLRMVFGLCFLPKNQISLAFETLFRGINNRKLLKLKK